MINNISILNNISIQHVTIILLILFIFGILKYYSDLYQCSMVEIYHFGSNIPGAYKLALLAGVHGNEPAGAVALTNMINSGYFERAVAGKNLHITVIPRANPCGLKKNNRYQPNAFIPDINRNFGNEYGIGTIAKNIVSSFSNADMVIDFHEGWGWHLENNSSVGSCVLPTDTVFAKELGRYIVTKLNENIQLPSKKFSLITKDYCSVETTLRCLMNKKERDYILIETTGQNDIQPLNIRTNQVKTVVDTVLKHIS